MPSIEVSSAPAAPLPATPRPRAREFWASKKALGGGHALSIHTNVCNIVYIYIHMCVCQAAEV